MFVPAEVLRSHIGYTAWASGLLVEAADGLTGEEPTRDFGTADKSVLGTLVHVFAADRLWLARLKVDDELEFGRLPHRQIGGPSTLKNAAGIDADLMKNVREVGAVDRRAHV